MLPSVHTTTPSDCRGGGLYLLPSVPTALSLWNYSLCLHGVSSSGQTDCTVAQTRTADCQLRAHHLLWPGTLCQTVLSSSSSPQGVAGTSCGTSAVPYAPGVFPVKVVLLVEDLVYFRTHSCKAKSSRGVRCGVASEEQPPGAGGVF
eukprot:3932928-Rhodomonas_salina.2